MRIKVLAKGIVLQNNEELKMILSYQYLEMVLKQVERKMDFKYTT